MKKLSHLALLVATLAPLAGAQDLYDPATLRTINIVFQDANWMTLLHQNYQSQTEILADLTMEGVTYDDVGVRIRGNTSYFALPTGSEKFSISVSMDAVVPGQDLLGYNSLNLNNAFSDPTFCREVAFSNFLSQYIPNGRANHVTVTLNGQNWGVYANVQQFNKDMLRDYFDDEDGMRVKCPNNPNGPGLQYNGPNPAFYTAYEIKNDGGLADPVGEVIAVCNAVDNGSLANLQSIDAVFAIDPSLWTVVLENLLSDDDSYVNKGCDFVTYRNPVDGRTHLLQTDGNETWREADWAPDYHFNQSNKPVLNHVLSVPELRQRYMAHFRTVMEAFDWAQIGPTMLAHRDLIDAAVMADPKKLYTYQNFLDNFSTTVNIPGGFFGGNVIGLQEFVDDREAILAANVELSSPAPVITGLAASDDFPLSTDAVYITAQVAGPIDPVAGVELFYLPAPGTYSRTPMLDDGLSGDGAAGDGVYGALLPITATDGQRVRYYVGATSANAFSTVSYEPALTELAPATLSYAFGGAGVRITEYMYSAADGEYFELTNNTGSPIDLTGWSMDDKSEVPGTFDLSAASILAPGESLIVTDADPTLFSAAWSLSGVTVLGPNATATLGRNDQINLYDAANNLVDRLTYGDEDFPGSVRTKDESGQACDGALGTDDAFGWTAALVADSWGAHTSVGGDTGSPGSYVAVACAPPGFSNFCSGDGGDQMGCTDCPCANNAPAGTVGGCLNSAASSARLLASGDASVSLPTGDSTDLRFSISGAPATAFCILNSGDSVAPGSMTNPCFGMNSGAQAAVFDGLRCAINNTRRHGGRSADANGDVGITNDPWGGEGGPAAGLALAGAGFTSGQTRYFQVINRDDPLLSCMRGLNTSQAIEVTFLP